MSENAIQKLDRRTAKTKGKIKDALLSLIEKKLYSSISVSELCRHAGVSRGTFYTHYQNLSEPMWELLGEVISSIGNIRWHLDHASAIKSRDTVPLCHFIRESKKYQCLFVDISLTEQILEMISKKYDEDYVDELSKKMNIDRSQVETIIYFQTSGCLSVIRKMLKSKNEEWCSAQCIVDRYIHCALTGLIESPL